MKKGRKLIVIGLVLILLAQMVSYNGSLAVFAESKANKSESVKQDKKEEKAAAKEEKKEEKAAAKEEKQEEKAAAKEEKQEEKAVAKEEKQEDKSEKPVNDKSSNESQDTDNGNGNSDNSGKKKDKDETIELEDETLALGAPVLEFAYPETLIVGILPEYIPGNDGFLLKDLFVKFEGGDNLDNYNKTFELEGGSITISAYTGENGNAVVDFAVDGEIVVDEFSVKAGPGYNLYSYEPGAKEDQGLYSPKGSISHITICYSEETVDPTGVIKLKKMVSNVDADDTSFDIEVKDADGNVVWEGSIKETDGSWKEITLPAPGTYDIYEVDMEDTYAFSSFTGVDNTSGLIGEVSLNNDGHTREITIINTKDITDPTADLKIFKDIDGTDTDTTPFDVEVYKMKDGELELILSGQIFEGEAGELVVPDLLLDEYYIRELTPSEPYSLVGYSTETYTDEATGIEYAVVNLDDKDEVVELTVTNEVADDDSDNDDSNNDDSDNDDSNNDDSNNDDSNNDDSNNDDSNNNDKKDDKKDNKKDNKNDDDTTIIEDLETPLGNPVEPSTDDVVTIESAPAPLGSPSGGSGTPEEIIIEEPIPQGVPNLPMTGGMFELEYLIMALGFVLVSSGLYLGRKKSVA